MKTLLQFYEQYKEQIAAYQYALRCIHFDQSTIAPEYGKHQSNRSQAILFGECFAYENNPEAIQKIETLYKKTDNQQLKKEIELRLKDLQQFQKVPKEQFVAFKKSISDCEVLWEKAKQQNSYSLLKAQLNDVINKQKEIIEVINKDSNITNYDALLQQYQKGVSLDQYEAFFDKIKKEIIPLINEIQKSNKKIDHHPLFEHYNIEGQKQFIHQLETFFNINPKTFYITQSAHPFTSAFAIQDVRFTIKYLEDNIQSSIFATAHEFGHALYEAQINPEFENTTFQTGIGCAIHESQSRLIENHIARHPSFWKVHYPKLQSLYPEYLKDVSLSSFVEKCNATQASFIRIEADELTYPLHILIRYEIEKAIFNDNLNLDQLEQVWNDKYETYLGIRPETPSEGILQDIHWSAGAFGYFPTYALGSAVASQLFRKMELDLNVEETLQNEAFEPIARWLKTNVHQYGASLGFDEILIQATGEPFNPTFYIEYLTKKYRKLYQL